MSKRILGLDLGTNSIGWGVVDDLGAGQFEVIKRGVHIFHEGVKIEKGNESSKASERTGYRSARRLKFRRKLRKVRTLKVLSEEGYCPKLSLDELKAWQSKKIYPANEAFRQWCKTSDPEKSEGTFENPYYYRWLAATEKLDLGKEENRFKLGRAFYHMAQRRGFKSNRLDTTQESDGVVKADIDELTKNMEGRTLGQYFWEDCYGKGAIRGVHPSRDDHYQAEFNFISEKQGIADELRVELWKAIFYQRPLKSQKGLVASCPFEPKKKRAPVSHPLFEEFRMIQTLNNIKIRLGADDPYRSLTEEEKRTATGKFFRVSKPQFDFKDIAKELSKARNVGATFNYRDNQSLSGCPFSAQLSNLFGEDYKQVIFDSYVGSKTTKAGDKRSPDDILHEVWHVLFSFDDIARVREYATGKLGMDEEGAEKFAKIKVRQGYGALSLKAIRKILPFLKQGLIYSHAVFFANLDEVIGRSAEDIAQLKLDIASLIDSHRQYVAEAQCVNSFVREYKDDPCGFERKYDLRKVQEFEQHLPGDLRADSARLVDLLQKQIALNNGNGEYFSILRLEDRVGEYLEREFDVSPAQVKQLYHPSKEETYKAAPRHSDGKYYLGDPRISSIKNPVFMRAMHRLKAIINELLKQNVINGQTLIHLEMARDLNDANKRAALRTWQRQNETKRKQYKETIEEHLKAQGHDREADADEILKYQFWLEQNENCVYCGEKIGLAGLFSSHCEIEHTVPRSLCCDDSQENKTLAHRACNREKHKRIPFECANHDEILQHIEHWEERVEELNKLIERKRKASRSATTKELKDRAIQARVVLEMDRNYLRGKYRRFTMDEVTGGFKNSQLVDTRIITKYVRTYLKTVFGTVHTVNGKATDSFRRCWGIEKSRDNHAHHTVDAIVVACITRDQYDRLARYYHDCEERELGECSAEPSFLKPWDTFTEDMKSLKNEILVSSYYPNNLLKQTKKKLRSNGVIQRTSEGTIKFQRGKTARGALHQDTFYGAIKRIETNKKGEAEEVIKYVVRKQLSDLSDSDLKKIVDNRVREIAIVSRIEESRLKKEIEALKKKKSTSDEANELTIKQEINGLESRLTELYVLPNKNGTPTPIKRVRIYSKLTNPIELKTQRDVSSKKTMSHKTQYYVNNDSNYLMEVYDGERRREFNLYRNIEAANGLLPESTDRLRLQKGNRVLLYECVPEEVWRCTSDEVVKRMYVIQGLSSMTLQKKYTYGVIVLLHALEARAVSALKVQDGDYSVDEPYMPQRKFLHTRFKALVEGRDFELTSLGELRRL